MSSIQGSNLNPYKYNVTLCNSFNNNQFIVYPSNIMILQQNQIQTNPYTSSYTNNNIYQPLQIICPSQCINNSQHQHLIYSQMTPTFINQYSNINNNNIIPKMEEKTNLTASNQIYINPLLSNIKNVQHGLNNKMSIPPTVHISKTKVKNDKIKKNNVSNTGNNNIFTCKVCINDDNKDNNNIELSPIFNGLKNFLLHIKIHKHDCGFCGKSFTRPSNLREHIRIHTGDKPYKCIYCSKGFAQQHSLRDHLRTHTGEKPFKCDQCNKGFAVKSNLRVHYRIHTGEKPHQCKICLKRFTQKGALNGHYKNIHKTNNFK